MLLLALIIVPLAACRTTGDFGRQEPSFVRDTVVPATRQLITGSTGQPSSSYELTPDEERLRAYRFTLLEGTSDEPIERRIARKFDEAGANLGLREREYQRERRIEHAAGVAELDGNGGVRRPDLALSAIAADIEIIDRFEAAAIRVYHADRRRLRVLRRNGDVPSRDVVDVTGRVAENRDIVEDTILAIHNRIDDYVIEARRSVLEYPGESLRRLDNAISRLSLRAEKLEHRLRAVIDPQGVPRDLDLAG